MLFGIRLISKTATETAGDHIDIAQNASPGERFRFGCCWATDFAFYNQASSHSSRPYCSAVVLLRSTEVLYWFYPTACEARPGS
jgi:hypothetical protein